MSACSHVRAAVDAFVDGELGDADADRVREHLRGCGSCGDRVGEQRRLRRLMASSEPPAMSSALGVSLLSLSVPGEVGRDPARAHVPAPTRSPERAHVHGRRAVLRRPVLVGAGAVMVLGAGVAAVGPVAPVVGEVVPAPAPVASLVGTSERAGTVVVGYLTTAQTQVRDRFGGPTVSPAADDGSGR